MTPRGRKASRRAAYRVGGDLRAYPAASDGSSCRVGSGRFSRVTSYSPDFPEAVTRKFGALFLAAVVALVITGPEQPSLLLPVPTMRKLAVFLVPAGVGLVKAASLLTFEVTYPLHQRREHPRHGTYHLLSVECFASDYTRLGQSVRSMHRSR